MVDRASSGRVCACSLRSMLVSLRNGKFSPQHRTEVSQLYSQPKDIDLKRANFLWETDSHITKTFHTLMSGNKVKMPPDQSSFQPTDLRLNPMYVKLYLLCTNLFVNGLVPCFVLIILNILTFLKILSYEKVIPSLSPP